METWDADQECPNGRLPHEPCQACWDAGKLDQHTQRYNPALGAHANAVRYPGWKAIARAESRFTGDGSSPVIRVAVSGSTSASSTAPSPKKPSTLPGQDQLC